MKEDTLNQEVGILIRREIEARILKPFYQAVSLELGEAKTKDLLKDIVINEAKAVGVDMHERVGSDSIEGFAEQWEPWFRGGALEIDELEKSETA